MNIGLQSEIFDNFIHKNTLSEAFQKASEEQLLQVQAYIAELEKFKIISDNANYGILISDLHGNIEYVNKYFARIHGYEPDELMGKQCSLFHNAEELKIFKSLNKELLEQGHFNAREVWHTCKKGITFPMLLNGIILKDKQGQPLFVSYTAVDISEMKQLQEQLIRSERLAFTGQLAASIAHEINSPLQGIAFLLSSLKKKYQDDSEDIEILGETFRSIRNTVKRLLDLNRPNEEIKQLVCVNGIIVQTIKLVSGYLKRSKVIITLDLDPTIPKICASPQQLTQVFINLINNAIEAITGTSEPKDGFQRIMSKQGKIIIATKVQSDNIIIQFIDTGPGLSDDEQDKLFDPFFTRKNKMGLGVGLTICQSIINAHKGSITAVNLHGKGALFTIALPV